MGCVSEYSHRVTERSRWPEGFALCRGSSVPDSMPPYTKVERTGRAQRGRRREIERRGRTLSLDRTAGSGRLWRAALFPKMLLHPNLWSHDPYGG